jgi:hypothetical protein
MQYTKQVLSRLLEIVLHRDFDFAQLQGAIIALVWGIYLLCDRGTPAYRMLSPNVAPLWLGVMLVLIGTMQVIALTQQSGGFRYTVSILATGVWAFLAILLLRIHANLLITPTAVMFAMGAAFGFFRTHRLK